MDTAEDIRRLIHQFIGEFLANGSLATLRDDAPLRTSGLIDSIGTLRLIGFIEEKFNIEVKADEAEAGNLDRVEDIIRFVRRKQSL